MNAKQLYESLWADNGTHSEDAIIARLESALATARRDERERCAAVAEAGALAANPGGEYKTARWIEREIRALPDVDEKGT